MSVHFKLLLLVINFILINTLDLYAQKQGPGSVEGIVIDKTSNNPVEFANVVIQMKNDNTISQTTVTNNKGKFAFGKLPFGEYLISYSFIGFDKVQPQGIVIDAKRKALNLGKLYISETSQTLGQVEVTAHKSTFVNKIDRKVFNVGEDLMSKTGSVSELMQNVPSLQVDIDGNVSLRGSDNVMILIDGRPSALMGANRAAVLQQMPASSIDKIEIITNPSAKYKPDGTSGIINIVMKKNKSLGLNGTVAANAGNGDRYNGNFLINYNPGKINLFASYARRQDFRLRYTNDYRKHSILPSDTIIYSQLNATERSRPLSNILHTGIDYQLNDHNKTGVSGSYNYRSFTRTETDVNTFKNTDLSVSKDYDRTRFDPEYEKDMELTAYFKHTFAKEGHELNADFTTSRSNEQEDNHYSNIYRVPVTSSTFDNTLIKQADNESQFTLEYLNPISEKIKFESGYVFESRNNDADFYGESFNPLTNLWDKDLLKSNRFKYTENIHVLYATYEQDLGKFGFLAGLRAEQAYVNSNQVTTDTILKNQYFRLYPTLHMLYKLSGVHELQLNYSHRVHRPEGEDMNPFPKYQDPYNLREGNPHLKPADIHSVEFGFQYKKKSTTFLSTIYYRYIYNDMTDIITYLNNSVKLTTKENLSKSSSAGLELILATAIGKIANINLSTNTFYNTIDASSLGYSKNKAIFAWSANLSAGINLSKSTVWQITSSYLAERLTPQGKQLPAYVMNTGFKHEFLKNKAAFIVTVSDVFNSLKNNTVIDTPALYEKIERRRSARITYAGFSYTFGKQKKKSKDNTLKFDNQL